MNQPTRTTTAATAAAVDGLAAQVQKLPRLADDPDYLRASKVYDEATGMRDENDGEIARLLAEMNTPTLRRQAEEDPLEQAKRLMSGTPVQTVAPSLHTELQRAQEKRARAQRAAEAAGRAMEVAQNRYRTRLSVQVAKLTSDAMPHVRELLVQLDAANKRQMALMEQVYRHCGVSPTVGHRDALVNPLWVECSLSNLADLEVELQSLTAEKRGLVARGVDAVVGALSGKAKKASAPAEDDWTPEA